MIFIDTNVILRFVLDDNPTYSLRAKAIFEKIDQGEVKVFISLVTISETIFTLERSYKYSKSDIFSKLLPIVKLENAQIDNQDILEQALNFYKEKNINFPDAYQAAQMLKKKVKKIYSFDSHFDRFSQIKRLVD